MQKLFKIFLFFIPLIVGHRIYPMKIVLGSSNPSKIAAFTQAIASYDFLANAEINTRTFPSGVSAQPLSLQETVQGAQNRAQAASAYGDMGVGIESGLCNIPGTERYVNIDVCCICINDKSFFGFAPAFEIPPKILESMLLEKLDLSQAINKVGLTSNAEIGSAQGAAGIFTKGRMTRTDCMKQAVIMALIQLDFPEL